MKTANILQLIDIEQKTNYLHEASNVRVTKFPILSFWQFSKQDSNCKYNHFSKHREHNYSNYCMSTLYCIVLVQ
jgi:hypothetical protein